MNPPVIWPAVPDDAPSIAVIRQATHDTDSSYRLYQDRAHENRIGYIAEWAFAQWQQLPLPWKWTQTTVDPGYDFLTRQGRVDVKGSAKSPWALSVKEQDLKRSRTDAFVLAWVQADSVQFLGWATITDMQRDGYWHVWSELGNRARVLKTHCLRSMQEF